MLRLHPALRQNEFWYQDCLLVIERLPDIERDAVDLTTQLSRHITLKTPFVSSPMDTVTESQMAILLALLGGVGIIHYNLSPQVQAEEIRKVKRWERAFITDPVVLGPKNVVADVVNLGRQLGFYSIPITQNGSPDSKLVGLVTHRDIRYFETPSELATPLKEVMTPYSKLITANKEETISRNNIRAANKLIRQHNLDTLPIVDRDGNLAGLVTDSDLRKNDAYPLATKDPNKQLMVFGAVESRLGLAQARLPILVEAGADGVVIDASVVFAEQLTIAKFIKKKYPHLEVILGNVDSGKMVTAILENGWKNVDAIRVGIGPGAACITQEQLGVGRAQASAVWECTQAAQAWAKKKKDKVPLIADGGIKRASDVVKALALGADTVMMGGLLAGLEESPGEPEFDEEAGHLVKKYRGMGSAEAMAAGGAVRYRVDDAKIRVVEGKVKRVGYKGSGYVYLPHLIAAVKQSIHKLGFGNVPELQKDARIVPNHL